MSKFNFNIDTIEDNNNIFQKSKNVIKTLYDLYNELLYVDLGLPSGTLWGKYNIGVNPEKLVSLRDWYGNYYAWGEIEPHSPNKGKNALYFDFKKGEPLYNWKTYKYAEGEEFRLKKYVTLLSKLKMYNKKNILQPDDLTVLQLEDDVVNITYDDKWKMPTKQDYYELTKYTKIEDIQNYNDIQLLNGKVCKGNNGNEIFMPFGGCYSSIGYNGFMSYGCYWTSSLEQTSAKNAYYFFISDNDWYNIDNSPRCEGYTVRGVLKKVN